MNILQVHGRSTLFGGASVHTGMLAQAFSASGNVVLVFPKNNIYLSQKKFPPNVKKIHIETEGTGGLYRKVRAILKIVDDHEIDLIHTHHRNADVIGAFVKFFRPKVQYVATMHGQPVQTKSRKEKLHRLINRILVGSQADAITYISKFVRTTWKSDFSSSKGHMIYNGSAAPNIDQSASAIRQELKLNDDDFIVMSLGNVAGVKRFDLFIEIARILKDSPFIKFVVIGDGEDKKTWETVTKRDNLNVNFAGYRPMVGNYIAVADIVISTAIGEGFGRTLTEAKALKKVTMGYDQGGPKEVIRDGLDGYLLPEGNTHEYAAKILYLAENPKLLKELGLNSYKDYQKRFSADVFSQNFMTLFRKLLNNKNYQ